MAKTKQSGKPIDFSIMPSFKCNLSCWFCMYNCHPNIRHELDYEKTKLFLAQFDWSQINAFGLYGGEPSVNRPLYHKFIKLVPDNVSRFIITNGTWSRSLKDTNEFLGWCVYMNFHVIVSSTPEHIKYQDRSFLESLAMESDGVIELKEPDEIHAQGRARGKPGVINDCKMSCQRKDRNIRLGLKPDGNIVFQNCHGEYHIIQTYEQSFDGILERTKKVVEECISSKELTT